MCSKISHLGVGIDYFIGQKEKEKEFTKIIYTPKVAYWLELCVCSRESGKSIHPSPCDKLLPHSDSKRWQLRLLVLCQVPSDEQGHRHWLLDGVKRPYVPLRWASMVTPCPVVTFPFLSPSGSQSLPSAPSNQERVSGTVSTLGRTSNAHLVTEMFLKCSATSCDRGWSVLCN